MDDEVTVQDNWYTRLDIRIGATLREAEAAYATLSPGLDEDSVAMVLATEAIEGLRQPARRLYHDQQIKWSVTAEWHQRRFADRDRHQGWWSGVDDEESRERAYGRSPAA